jgi:hypothetical protein
VTTDASDWALKELNSLYGLDLLPPMLFGRYREYITRAEFASLLLILYETLEGHAVTYPDNSNFADITGHVFETEIRKAYEVHLVDGRPDGTFDPEGLLNRQEAAKMFVSFINIVEGFPPPTDINVSIFKDASEIGLWAAPYVVFAYNNNKIMQGDDKGNFLPKNNLTREQSLAMIYRTILQYEWSKAEN